MAPPPSAVLPPSVHGRPAHLFQPPSEPLLHPDMQVDMCRFVSYPTVYQPICMPFMICGACCANEAPSTVVCRQLRRRLLFPSTKVLLLLSIGLAANARARLHKKKVPLTPEKGQGGAFPSPPQRWFCQVKKRESVNWRRGELAFPPQTSWVGRGGGRCCDFLFLPESFPPLIQ